MPSPHPCVAVAELAARVRPPLACLPQRPPNRAPRERVQARPPPHSARLPCVCVFVCVGTRTSPRRGAALTRGTRGGPTPPRPGSARVADRAAAQPSPALPRLARRPLCWRPGSCPASRPAVTATTRLVRPRCRPPARRALTPGQQQQQRRQQRRQPGCPQQPAHGAAVAARSRSGAAPRPASGAARAAAAARARPIGPRGRHSPPAPPGRVPRARPRGDEAGARAAAPPLRPWRPASQSAPERPGGAGPRPRPPGGAGLAPRSLGSGGHLPEVLRQRRARQSHLVIHSTGNIS